MLVAGLLGYTGSMLMAGSATSIWGLVAYRFLVGLFSSGFTTYCGGILSDILNPEQRATFISLTMMPSMLLAMVTPFLSGLLTDLLGWRFGAFYLLIILMALFIPVVVWFVPETLSRLQMLKREPGEETPEERAAAHAPVKKINPIFPLKLVLSWPMLGTVVANATLFATSYLQNSQFSLIVGHYFSFSATVIGLLLIPVGIGRVVGTIFGGKISDMAREAAHKRGWNRRTGNLIVAFLTMLMAVCATALFGTVVFSAVVGAFFASLGGLGAMVCRSITFSYAVEMHGKNAGGATAGLVCVQFLIVTAALLLVSWMFSFVGVIWTFILAAAVLAVTMVPFAYVIVSNRHAE